MDKYLSELESSPVRTLQEVVEFNKTYEHLELPPGTPSPSSEKQCISSYRRLH